MNDPNRKLVLKTFQVELTIPVAVWNELSGDRLITIQEEAESRLQNAVKQFNAEHLNAQMQNPY